MRTFHALSPVGAAVALALLAPSVPARSVAALAAPHQRPAAPSPVPRPPADPSLGTLISGEPSYVDGTHVWTDYVYDDRGPNLDPLPGGDEPYPAAPHRLGTADLVQVQLGTGANGLLQVDVVLRTVVEDQPAIVGIGIDRDRKATTGAPSLPGGQWANTDPLGIGRLLTISTDGSAALLSWKGGQWRTVRRFDGYVDPARNVVGALVPGLRPGRARWQVVAVAGRSDGAQSWVDGSAPIQDVAYLRAEDPTDIGALSVPQQLPQDSYQPYQDWDQADVLAGRLPAGRAVATVRFGTLRSREPRTRQGFNAFLYHSSAPVPEGVQGAERLFSSAFQPYSVWIPRKLPERRPLVVFLHGSDQYQNVNLVYFNNPVDPAGIQPFHDLEAVTIFPNGRTPQWGTPLADRDALDAMDDALARRPLRLDPDRVVVTGISSGGYGTFHLASRYPDRFTGAYSIVGGAGGPGVTPLENLTNLPFRASNGLADPLVDYSVWRDSADRLKAAETVDYRTVLITTGSHNGAVAEGACFLEDLISRDRARNPARVRFRVPTPDAEVRRLGLQPGGAYWTSGLTLRRSGDAGGIEAHSHAKRQRYFDRNVAEVGENVVSGADFCGPNPGLRRGQQWQTEGAVWKVSTSLPAGRHDQLDVKLTNLATAAIDLRRAGFDAGEPVLVRVRSDGPTRLTFTGWGGTKVLSVTAGPHSYRVDLQP